MIFARAMFAFLMMSSAAAGQQDAASAVAGGRRIPVVTAIAAGAQVAAANPIISTVAGTGVAGFFGDGGPAASAGLYYPQGVAWDGAGSLYIADLGNMRVRKVSPAGTITTIAGTGAAGFSGDGGPAVSARLNYPGDVAVDAAGNLYIADRENHRIRKVSCSGIITTVAGNGIGGYFGDGGPATSAGLYGPVSVALDASGNLYIADTATYRIRRVSFSGIITTVAGNGIGGYSGDGGPATSAQLNAITGVAADGLGNIYIADPFNYRIRKVSPSGIISTVAGTGVQGHSGDGGPATSAQLDLPSYVRMDAVGNLYIVEYGNNCIRKVSPSGIITTVAGTGAVGYFGDGGPATSAALNGPEAVQADPFGNLYIGDTENNRVRMVQPGVVTPLSITTSAPLPQPAAGVAYYQALAAYGGTAPYTWSMASGSLPDGLTISGAGLISGTPIATGSFSFTVQVHDGAGATASKAFAFVVPVPVVIATESPLLSSWAGGAFSQALQATGGVAPYLWSVTSGSLPGGLTLSSAGVISGTPTTAGVFAFTVQARDAVATTASKAFTLTTVASGFMNQVGVLSQVASGGGWETAIWITNSTTSPVPISLKFHGDAGNDMSIAYTATQEGDTEAGSGAALNRVINPNTTLVVATGSGVAANSQGWAEVSANGAVSGFGVFRYAPHGLDPQATGFITPWEGTVPLQTQLAATTMVLPFDNTGGFSTGFALGNLTAAHATVTATLYDENGSQLGSAQSVSLSAYGHLADMVGTRWTFSAGKRGVIEFAGPAMTGLGLRASPYGALTSAPVALPGSLGGMGVLSQVASGGNWDTALWLTNSDSAAIPVQLKFHGDSGADMSLAYTVTQAGATQAGIGSTLNRTINPNTTLVLETGQGVAANVQGWAEVDATGTLSGFAVFRYAPQGLDPQAAGFITPWEGTVPLQTQVTATTMVLPFDNTGGFSTGFALGNLTAAQAVVIATLYDENGAQLGSPQSISLSAYGHMSDMAATRWTLSAGKRGIVKFTGPPMMGIGLRASPYGTLTSVPTVLQ